MIKVRSTTVLKHTSASSLRVSHMSHSFSLSSSRRLCISACEQVYDGSCLGIFYLSVWVSSHVFCHLIELLLPLGNKFLFVVWTIQKAVVVHCSGVGVADKALSLLSELPKLAFQMKNRIANLCEAIL